MVNAEGFPLLDQNGQPIRIPATAQTVEITRQGDVIADSQRIGRIQLVQFPDDQALRRLGGGLYASNVDPIPADARVETHQGILEGSNVVSISELTTMLDITRRYESAQRVIDSEHERARKAIDRLARVA
jgi:flagellar basal-body rod protein FlgF